MKLKIIILFLTFFFLITISLTFILFDNNIKLKKEINKQISLTNDIKRRDSLFTAKNKGYSQSITKYVDSTYYTMGNKKITSDQLVAIFNKIDKEDQNRQDSLIYYKLLAEKDKQLINEYAKQVSLYNKEVNMLQNAYKKSIDSLDQYEGLFNYAKKLYRFNLFVKKDSANNFYISSTMSKADSADILYKYFKHRMKQISPGTFTIDLSGEPTEINIKPDKASKKNK